MDATDHRVQLVPVNDLADDLRAQIRSLDRRTEWGPFSDPRQLVWLNQPRWVAVVLLGDILASHVGVMDHEVLIAGRPQRITGITSVMTEPALQGKGYATAALDVATAFMIEHLPVPFALLTALDHRRSLYAGRGWQTIRNPVFCDQPTGKIPLNVPGRHAMALPLGSVTLPSGDIDLCGLPW